MLDERKDKNENQFGSSQRAVWRNGGCNPAENFVRKFTLAARNKGSGMPPLRQAAIPLSASGGQRCRQDSATCKESTARQ